MCAIPTVIVFCTRDCQHSRTAKEYLSSKGVPFLDLDISTDAAAVRQLIALTGRLATPTVVVGKEVMIGFDRVRLEELLMAPDEKPPSGEGDPSEPPDVN